MATASMTDRRRAVAALAAERGRDGAAGRSWKRAAVILVILVAMALLTLVVLWFLGFFSTPPEVAAIRRLVDEQVTQFETAARTGTAPDQVAGFSVVMDKMRELPSDVRQQAGREMGRLFEARERAEMASYFALPADKRQAELDRRIKADEDRRKQWQAQRERRDQQNGDRRTAGNGGGSPAGNSPGDGGPAGGAPAGGGPPGGRRGGTEESRNDRSKRQIDRTTPEQRAQRAEYRRAVEERRTQLGLSPSRRG